MPVVGYRHWTHANESERSLQKHGGPSYMMCLKLPERASSRSVEELVECHQCGGSQPKADDMSFTDQMLAILGVERKPRVENLGASSTPGGLKFARRSMSMPLETNFSSRSFDANIDKLLINLAGKPDRSARFRTVISLLIQGKETQFEGICEGQIINERKGTQGFGYDPVFIPTGSHKTFAEMSLAEKGKYSHRAKATEKLVAFLNTL